MGRPTERVDFVDAVQWTAIDGLRIPFIEEAKLQGPDILMLSPWPEGLAAYRDCWRQLTAAGRVVALDLPGFGASEGRDDLASPQAMAKFLMKVIERFRLRHPHLVAPGIWWTLAADISLAEPGALESLIVGPVMMFDEPDTNPSSRRPTRALLESQIRAALAGSNVPPERQRQILRRFAGSRFRSVATYLSAHRAAARGAAEALSCFPTPVLTIEGRGQSTVIGPVTAKSWPPSRQEALGGSFAWMEAPEVFGQLVADWVKTEYRRVAGLTIAQVGTRGAGNETAGGHEPPS